MPDPDFDQIAGRLTELHDGPVAWTNEVEYQRRQKLNGLIVEQLRHVWNARGAADTEAVEQRLATLTGWVSSEPYRQHLREAIEALNRQ